jgi:AraC-like DNA-binding protein
MTADDVIGETLPTFRLSSDEIGGPSAYAAFGEVTQDIFAIGLPGPASADRFQLEMASWHLGTVMLGSIRASAMSFYRSADTVRKSGLDHIMVQLYTSGGFKGRADDYEIEVLAGDICIFDLAGTLQTTATDFHNLTLLAPRSWFVPDLPNMRSFNGLVMDRRKPLTELLAAHLLALAERAPLLTTAEAAAVARGTVALISALISSIPAAANRDPGPVVSSVFRNVCAYIDQRLAAADLQPTTIAAEFGMSRATLYRLFEPVGGVSDYIRRRRLACAALNLSSPAHREQRIGQIAYHWGFPSEAVFSRNFKALFGMSPTEARGRADRLWAAQVWTGANATPERDFMVWMKTLRMDQQV